MLWNFGENRKTCKKSCNTNPQLIIQAWFLCSKQDQLITFLYVYLSFRLLWENFWLTYNGKLLDESMCPQRQTFLSKLLHRLWWLSSWHTQRCTQSSQLGLSAACDVICLNSGKSCLCASLSPRSSHCLSFILSLLTSQTKCWVLENLPRICLHSIYMFFY